MEELYEIWDACPIDELPRVPAFEDFVECYEEIDVGYDCFIGDDYAFGPYALIYDEEKFRRDLWGWSAQIAYLDENWRYCTRMVCHKMGSAEEAYDELCRWAEENQ